VDHDGIGRWSADERGRRDVLLAYDFPVAGMFLTFLWFFIWVLWLFLLFRVVIDIFRDHELSGWAKALWLIFVIVMPYLGVLVYVIARGSGMGRRDAAAARAQQDRFDSYVREVASSGSTADELTKLAKLRDDGVITAAEFDNEKSKLLGGAAAPV
jgi:Short C-terminal domain/Phospholipase_D-nuclease N-terminal